MMYQNAVAISHELVSRHVRPGDTVVDATAGNGNDTLFLVNLVGELGKVYAFDIQQCALEQTALRLERAGVLERARLIHDGHENMKQHVTPGVRAVMFNFGYLPGGDHSLYTRPQTSIAAVEAAMELISDDGIVMLAIYSGGDTGFAERDTLLSYLRQVDNHSYSVLLHDFINYPNCPPLAVSITRCPK